MPQTPIVYIIFNRPRHTAQTFAAIRAQRPSQLFVIADGPRSNFASDAERCEAVRSVVDQINWPCEVHRNYSDVNLGLKRRVSTGLDWVFSQVERAIVLEDDCLPHADFFHFCDELLERYAYDERVAVITGNNFQDGLKRGNASYYFSKYNHCWGWATWRRAWQHYQGEIPFWPEWQLTAEWRSLVPDRIESRYWSEIFDQVRANKIDSWAYPWTASVWAQRGLTATPNVNLVSNIGFGPESTHTASASSPQAEMATNALGEITHPDKITQDRAADRYVFNHVFGGRLQRFPHSLYATPRRIVGRILRFLKKMISSELSK